MSELDAVARELGLDEGASVEEVVEEVRTLKNERDVVAGDAPLDVAAVTLADLRHRNKKLESELEGLRTE